MLRDIGIAYQALGIFAAGSALTGAVPTLTWAGTLWCVGILITYIAWLREHQDGRG